MVLGVGLANADHDPLTITISITERHLNANEVLVWLSLVLSSSVDGAASASVMPVGGPWRSVPTVQYPYDQHLTSPCISIKMHHLIDQLVQQKMQQLSLLL